MDMYAAFRDGTALADATPGAESPYDAAEGDELHGMTDTAPRLVLASRSPRRRSLLEEAGIAHEVIDPTVDDGELDAGVVSPRDWVAALAYLKARSGATALRDAEPAGTPEEPCYVLGADTVCVRSEEVVGKPRDRAHAERMLRSFMGGTHMVLTGVALVCPTTRRREVFVDEASVTWGVVGEVELRDYLESGAWEGKAGAYNLFDRVDAGWPITHDGDATTVVGLPMEMLRGRLRDRGFVIAGS